MMNTTDKIPTGTAEDLTNKKFGRLTPLYRIKNTSKGRGAKWRCQCDCGNVTDVLAANLKRNHTLSCGCLQKEKTSQVRFLDETGNRYGRLVVMERDVDYISSTGKKRVQWKCKCDCGNIVTIDGVSLRQGLTTSCGCYRSEQISNRVNDKYIGQTFHYITVLEKTNNKIESSGETIWKCKCNICNKEFFLSTGKIKTQISCGCLKDSYGVTIIKALLTNHNIPFETEKTFDNCIFANSNKKARFDFYVNNHYLLEFDGQQHYICSGGWNNEETLKST